MQNSIQDKIYSFEQNNIWFTADTHFRDEGAIRLLDRPFRTVAEMNEELILRWNDTVPEDGVVFHLGDFGGGLKSDWNKIISRLHGGIYLIHSRQDTSGGRLWNPLPFELVTPQLTITVDGQYILLNHDPFLWYYGCNFGVWQLYGHGYYGPRYPGMLDRSRRKMLSPLQYDVGVDCNDYRPVSFLEVKAKIEKQVAKREKRKSQSHL